MKFFYDLVPIIVFFIAYKFYGIYVATSVAIAAVLIQVLSTLARKKRPEIMQLITLGMVLLLGGATLIFKNDMFIKCKPTAVYWVLGIVLLGSQFIGEKNLVQKMLEKNLTLPPKAWNTLNASWYGFFFFMGLLNLIVVYSFDTDTWVNFKLFGTLILTLLFAIIQGFLVSHLTSNAPHGKKFLKKIE